MVTGFDCVSFDLSTQPLYMPIVSLIIKMSFFSHTLIRSDKEPYEISSGFLKPSYIKSLKGVLLVTVQVKVNV